MQAKKECVFATEQAMLLSCIVLFTVQLTKSAGSPLIVWLSDGLAPYKYMLVLMIGVMSLSLLFSSWQGRTERGIKWDIPLLTVGLLLLLLPPIVEVYWK